MKKIISAAAALILFASLAAPNTFAAESWREAFVTRLMKIISSDPSYNEVVLTDLDRNGVPEAFVLRTGVDGGISAGFTMSGSSIATIDVPSNIIGSCLTDITVYDDDGRFIFVGCEVPRYSSEIGYYKLVFDGDNLVAEKILKSYVSFYQTVPYTDIYSRDLLLNGYPNRAKIKDFVDSYGGINSLTATNSNAKLLINGIPTEVSGYTVNDSNYYKLRDIAMMLRSTAARFDVEWNDDLGSIVLVRGQKYTVVGGELSEEDEAALNVVQSSAPVYVDTEQYELPAYNINGSTYFRIRDISDIIGFSVDWDAEEQAVVIRTE